MFLLAASDQIAYQSNLTDLVRFFYGFFTGEMNPYTWSFFVALAFSNLLHISKLTKQQRSKHETNKEKWLYLD